MSVVGYCHKCGVKIIQAKVLGMFDDFTIKCVGCKVLVNVTDIVFKELAEVSESVDKASQKADNIKNGSLCFCYAKRQKKTDCENESRVGD